MLEPHHDQEVCFALHMEVIYKFSRNHLLMWIFKGLSVLLRSEWKWEYTEVSKPN